MKKHYGLFFLLLFAIGSYSQDHILNPADGHAHCGHDEMPQKYHYDYSTFDHEAYAKFMEVTTIEDLGDDFVPDRTTPIAGAFKKMGPITVTFKNVGQVSVDRYWVSNDRLVKYGEVKAGQTFQQSTHVGHKWVFKDRDITVGTYTVNRENTSYIVSPMDDSCFEIPVDLVVVYKSDGTGNESKAELYEKFDQMNKLCEISNWRVRFKIARFEEVYSDNYYSIPRDYDKMTEIRDQYTNFPKTVPLIQTGDIGTGGLGAVNGLAITRPQAASTWLHEIGHFFGLQHTHAEAGEGKELVDGSNCSVAGDLICDTPATPNTWATAYDCNYTGTERDPNGQLYRPDVSNVMAYSNGCTKDNLSLGQEKRLLFFLRNNYTEMNPCAAPVTPSDCKFDLIAGRARDIGTGGGQTYMVASNGQVFKKKPINWEALPFDFEGTKLDVTENGIPWVISTNNRIYYYENNRWVNTNGGGIEIGCGGNEVYVIATNNRIYRRVNNDWQILNTGGAKRIDVDEKGRPWIVGMDDRLYRFNNDNFYKVGDFKVQDIGTSSGDQYLWVLDNTGASLEYLGDNVFRPGASLGNSTYDGKNITVGNDNSVWILDQYGQIHRGTCKERSETEAPANLSAGTYSIISKQSNKALSLNGWGQNNGNNIIQWSYIGFENQHWELEHLGNNVFKIKSKYSNKALDVSNVSTNNRANIHQWDYVGGDNQKWKIQPVGDGYYRLLAVHSSKALSVNRNLTTNGANIHQWEYVGASSQKWRFDNLNAVDSGNLARSEEMIICNCDDTAEAGRMVFPPPPSDGCLDDMGSVVTLSGVPNGAQVVPPGYVLAYVLTEGVGYDIQAVGPSPLFVVNVPGLFTIHPIVYDPNTLDLNSVVGSTIFILEDSLMNDPCVYGDVDIIGVEMGSYFCCLDFLQMDMNPIPPLLTDAAIGIRSKGTVNMPFSATFFTGGQFVELEKGFEVIMGSTFQAAIDDCAETGN
jgi:hypothetical protein